MQGVQKFKRINFASKMRHKPSCFKQFPKFRKISILTVRGNLDLTPLKNLPNLKELKLHVRGDADLEALNNLPNKRIKIAPN